MGTRRPGEEENWPELLSAFFGIAPAGLAILDHDLRYLEVNDALARMNRTPAAAHLGRTIFDVLPEFEPVIGPILQRVLASGEPAVNVRVVGEVPGRPGDVQHRIVSYFPIRRGDAIQTIGVIAVDATEQTADTVHLSEAQRSAIVDYALDCIIMMDHRGKVVEFNPAAERTFGYSRHTALGRDLADLIIPPPMRGQHRVGLARHLAEGRTVLLNRRFEIVAMRADGTEFPVELTVIRLPSDGPPLFTGFIRDITERRKAEEQLKANTDHFRLLVEQMPAVVWRTDTKLSVLSIEGAGAMGEGRPLDRLIGQPLTQVLPPGDADGAIAAHRAALEGKPTTYELEWSGRTLHAQVEPLRDPDGSITGTIAVAVDVTDRKSAEVALRQHAERLRVLSRQLAEVQEADQRRIARELHDEIGQSLTALKLTLMTASRGAENEALREAQGLVDDILRQVRDLTLSLSSPVLEDLGLVAALLHLFERYTAHSHVRVDFQHATVGGQRFAREVETAAYRIVQEALTNVARHAKVNEVAVRVWREGSVLRAVIEDAGPGFDFQAALAAARSSGLAGMYERAAGVGGRLTVDAAPGRGTRVLAELPVPPSPPADRPVA
jgi:PAS domain S-box-containing protein